MAFARRHHNLTVLPTGEVLATGGVAGTSFDDVSQPVRAAEIWSPGTGTGPGNWTTLSSNAVTRGYHGTSLLLPDGRVLNAGSGEGAGAPSEKNAEIFSPPYLFAGARPTISSAPASVGLKTTFRLGTPNAAAITKVSLIRLGAVTHAFDENQRFMRLSFTADATGLTVTAPTSSNRAPPGHYMVFILNGSGVPSVATRSSGSSRPTPVAPAPRRGSRRHPPDRACARASCGHRRGRARIGRWRTGSSPSRSSGRPAAGCRPAPRTPPGSRGGGAKTGDSKSLPAMRPMSPQRDKASRSSATAPRRPADCRAASTQPYASAVATPIGGVTRSTGAAGNGRQPKQALSAAPAERERRAGQEERHVAAEARGELEQLVARHGAVGQLVHGDAARRPHRSSRRPARRARECAWSSVRCTPNRRPVASSTMLAARTARLCSGGPTSAPSTSMRDLAGLPPLRPQRVGEAHQAEQRLDAVIAVGLAREHAEEQVQLGVRLRP